MEMAEEEEMEEPEEEAAAEYRWESCGWET